MPDLPHGVHAARRFVWLQLVDRGALRQRLHGCWSRQRGALGLYDNLRPPLPRDVHQGPLSLPGESEQMPDKMPSLRLWPGRVERGSGAPARAKLYGEIRRWPKRPTGVLLPNQKLSIFRHYHALAEHLSLQNVLETDLSKKDDKGSQAPAVWGDVAIPLLLLNRILNPKWLIMYN